MCCPYCDGTGVVWQGPRMEFCCCLRGQEEQVDFYKNAPAYTCPECTPSEMCDRCHDALCPFLH